MIINAQRIILVHGSRLLADMLHHVICKADHLEIVREVNWYAELPAVIEGTDADWVLMSLPFDTSFPTWVDDYIATHPYIQFLSIFVGSGRVGLKSLGSPEEQLEDPSLEDLIHILECHPQQIQEK
ncbi:MAG: hypothetical protein M3R47_06645 [Chloroflexota bacterium]|nr:hypothetical protein [Chloroflexota bacterium]